MLVFFPFLLESGMCSTNLVNLQDLVRTSIKSIKKSICSCGACTGIQRAHIAKQ